MRKLEILLLILLAAASVLPYAGAVRDDYVFDDRALILQNPAIMDLDLHAIWAKPFWPFSEAARLYRPLAVTTLGLNWAMGNGSPRPFIVTNLILHCATTLAALWLLRRLFPGRKALAWGGAFLFAVHPIHVEPVVWISARSDTMAGLFACLAYRTWLDAESKGGIGRLLLAPALWALSLLSKETAALLPLIFVAHRLGGIPPFSPARRLRIGDAAWPLAALLVLLLRHQALRGLAAPSPTWTDNPLAHLGPAARVLGAAGVLMRQLGQIVTCTGFSVDYSYGQVSPGPGLYLLGAFGLALLLGSLCLVIRWGRRAPEAWGFAFFLIIWLVTSNMVVPISTIQADRVMYLPLLGLITVAVAALLRLRLERTHPFAVPGVIGLVTLVCGTVSSVRTRDWRDNESLFSAAVRVSPRSVKARTNLAQVRLLLKQDDPREVIELLRPVERFAKEYGPLLAIQARAHLRLGEDERAEELYRRALAARDTRADSTEILIELGNLALASGDGPHALAEFDAAATTHRLPENVAFGRASALSVSGRYAESAAAWRPLVEALPDSVPVRIACAWNLRKAGRAAEAAALLRAGSARGEEPRLLRELALALLAGAGTPHEALDAAARASTRDPSDENLAALAHALIATGRRTEAIATRARISDPDLLREIDALLAGTAARSR